MRRFIVVLVTLVVIALTAGACGEASPTKVPKYTQDTRGGGGGGGPMPYCQVDGLQMPVLYSPADGANVDIPGLTFHWVYNPAGCIPEEFEIQVSQTASFATHSGTTVNVGVDSWSPEVGLLPATVYYWRMRGLVSGGQGPWSPTWTFYTGPSCQAASLVAPEAIFPDGYMFVFDAPFFEWTYPDNACVPPGYHLQVSASEDFSTLAIDLVQPTPSKIATPATELPNCGVYYWRVAASSGGTDGPFSDTKSYSINAGGTCTAACTDSQLIEPIPVSPPHYANVGVAPTQGIVPGLLEWYYPMPCFPQGFGVRLNTAPDWSGPNLGGGVSPVTANGGNWSPAAPLEPATQYWWQVFAANGVTFGPPSAPRSFFTGPKCQSGSDSLPPTLVTPLDGAVVSTLHPALRYTAGEGSCIPDGYAIYLGTDPDFAGEPAYATLNGPFTTFIPDPLNDCTTYYWRVSPIQDEFVLPWSDEWSFTTNHSGQCPISGWHGQALKDAACYYGPGPGWKILGYFVAGERAPVFGKDMSGRWLATDNPDNPGERCWVLRDVLEVTGDVDKLRILNPPAVCKGDLPEAECVAMGGKWVQGRSVTGGLLPPTCQCP